MNQADGTPLPPEVWSGLQAVNAGRPKPPSVDGYASADAMVAHIDATLAWGVPAVSDAQHDTPGA